MLLLNHINAEAAETPARQDPISPAEARSLCGLLIERARRTPNGPAYTRFDVAAGRWRTSTWAQTRAQVGRWQAALETEGLKPGDRVAIMLGNRPEWVHFDLAALGLGLVTVPLYPNDRPESVRHQLEDSEARLLLLEGLEGLAELEPIAPTLAALRRVLLLEFPGHQDLPANTTPVARWLPQAAGPPRDRVADPGALATIVYTSGTTGPAKGVMLTHGNLLWNAAACLSLVPARSDDRFLSFLPLSHTLERTAGYYLALMAGTEVVYARSIPQLAEDLQAQRPTVLIAVPRIFERIHAKVRDGLARGGAPKRWLFAAAVSAGWARFQYRQGRGPWRPSLLLAPWLDPLVGARLRARLGGRLRVAVCGGAPLAPEIARTFVGLGVPLVQGYGLTEASPVISVNTLEDNIPASVGLPLPQVEWRIGTQDELLVRSPGIMRGYWGQPDATAAAIDAEGWLHTGDQAHLAQGHLYITGRIKEILVLATGEKVAPVDLEGAILGDGLFNQALVIGEGRPYLSVLAVPEPEPYAAWAAAAGLPARLDPSHQEPRLEQALLARVNQRLKGYPAAAKIQRLALVEGPWSIESGLMTPTLKLKRALILARHRDQVAALYAGHA
jgi:long-chain acyl-CoA synthetase